MSEQRVKLAAETITDVINDGDYFLVTIDDKVYRYPANKQTITDVITWKRNYIPGESVLKNTMVRDDTWTMISNTDTSERAAPQLIGDAEYMTEDTDAGLQSSSVITSGSRSILNQNRYIDGLRVQALTATEDYKFTVILRIWTTDETDGTYLRIPDIVIPEIGPWYEIPINPVIALAGQTVDVYLVTQNNATTSSVTGDWIYVGATSSLPGSNNWNTSPSEKLIRMSVIDAYGANKRSDLQEITPGSTVRFTQADDSSKYMEFSVDTINSDDGENYAWFGDPIEVSPGGRPDEDAICNMLALTPDAVTTSIATKASYWSTNTPSWCNSATGELYFDGVLQSGYTDSMFGVDFLSTQAEASAHWDVVAISSLSGISMGVSRSSAASSGSSALGFFAFNKTTDHIIGSGDGGTDDWHTLCRLETTLPSLGTYLYGISLTYRLSSTNTSVLFRYSINGGATWYTYTKEPKDNTDEVPFYYAFPLDLTDLINADDDFILQAAKENDSNTLTVHFADVFIQKVK